MAFEVCHFKNQHSSVAPQIVHLFSLEFIYDDHINLSSLLEKKKNIYVISEPLTEMHEANYEANPSHNLCHQHSTRSLFRILAFPLPLQFPAKALGRAPDDSSAAWTLATHCGDTPGVPSFQLQPGPVQVVGAIWGVNRECKISLPSCL